MGDISKKTLAILLLIAIVLSAVATWKSLSSGDTVILTDDSTNEGKAHVSLGINVEDTPSEPVEKTGQVALTVEEQ